MAEITFLRPVGLLHSPAFSWVAVVPPGATTIHVGGINATDADGNLVGGDDIAAQTTLRLGASVYEQQCAQCHGAQGQGSSGAFPALAGNRAVLLSEPDNLVQMVLHGGYAPATAGNPRPHGMPPFLHVLGDAEVAAVLSYVRGSWGNGAAPVSAMDVYQRREGRR